MSNVNAIGHRSGKWTGSDCT